MGRLLPGALATLRCKLRRVPVLVILATSTAALRAQTLTPILANGPASNRVNLVVLSEGYTSGQLGQFLVDATSLVDRLLETPPYDEYRSYFNAWAIAVASAESGSDHPGTGGPYRNTYFNSAYEFYNYVITIPPNGLDSNPAHGQAKVDALITNLAPQANLVVLLVNDPAPGGSAVLGGPGGTSARRPIITALNPQFPYSDIAAHESGHLFAGLVDEYTSAYPGYVPVEAPNATRQTNRSSIRWEAWIEPTTPVPTPNDFGYADVVGLFEGAQYQTTGWYRPKLDCKMQTLGTPFCEICSEQIVKTIYQVVRPTDGFDPPVSPLVLRSAQPVQFAVTPQSPRSHNLSIQWFTNGVPVGGVTETTVQLEPRVLGNGTHSVQVVVADETSLVRYDPAGLLRATNSWTVTVSLTELAMTAVRFLPDGRFRFTITGTAPNNLVIEASPDLNRWTRLSTNTLVNGRLDYTNAAGDGIQLRFYRALSPP